MQPPAGHPDGEQTVRPAADRILPLDRATTMPAIEFDVVVLAGGRSRRMGEDKTVLNFGGKPLIVRVTTALQQAGAATLVVVSSEENAARITETLATAETRAIDGFPAQKRRNVPGRQHRGPVVLLDRWPDSGPVGGVLTGVAYGNAPWVLVCAADLPFLTDDSVVALLQAVARADRTASPAPGAFVPIVDKRFQWLFGLYRRSVLVAMQGAFDAGERSVAGCLRATAAAISPVDFDDALASSLFDVDTPEELDAARRRTP